MKYVCIDDGAVAELISGREYQSIDFEEGNRLISSLAGRVQFLAKLGKIFQIQDAEGVFLATAGAWKSKRYVVIDCEQSSLFTQLRSSETLTSFQKLLRFCSKYWFSGVYNSSEKLISGTSKAILFPLPFSSNSPFRIAIEREPMKDRLKKRDMDGKFLLVYKSSFEGANSASEEANETNFRRVYERIPDIYSQIIKVEEDMGVYRNGGRLKTDNLDGKISSLRNIHLPFREWLPLLTKQQKKFVSGHPSHPHRLQGPAGTGKTLALILRTIKVLEDAARQGKTAHALLVTHSEATRESINNSLASIDGNQFSLRDRRQNDVTLSVQTLASLCATFLSQSISESEFIDRDAQDSKILQRLYIEQAISQARSEDFNSFKPHLSQSFRTLFEKTSNEDLSTLVQHEISVQIKGRAGDSLDVYKKCPPLRYGLGVENDADKGFIFSIFRRYQKQLETSSQFDTDDVVISAVGQLDTPIWRRRRSREGYDFIAIDETHLFNINELHVFHHFTRHAGEFPFSFTIDQAQSVGDRGWNDFASFSELFGSDANNQEEKTNVTAIFRNSPAIRDFSHSILASGATLFTNFENTLEGSHSVFTPDDERRSQKVRYIEYPDDITMIEGAFKRADEVQSETQSNRSQILITTLSESLMGLMREFSEKTNKPVTLIERRGDYTRVKQAEKSGHVVVGHADYVGGLEFNAVIIVGVDKGRVPQEGESEDSNSRSYSSYVAHNRLYVASSRARYALNLLGVKSRGASEIIRAAAHNKLIEGIE